MSETLRSMIFFPKSTRVLTKCRTPLMEIAFGIFKFPVI